MAAALPPGRDFVRQEGASFTAHLLRRLSDAFVSDAAAWFEEIGIAVPPRSVSTLLLLADQGPSPVTGVAERLSQSHQLVTIWVRQLEQSGLVASQKDAADARRTLVRLTPKGEAEAARLRTVLKIAAEAYCGLFEEAQCDLLDCLWRVHDANRRRPLLERFREKHRTAAESAS